MPKTIPKLVTHYISLYKKCSFHKNKFFMQSAKKGPFFWCSATFSIGPSKSVLST